LHQDYEIFLETIAPHESVRQYRHNDTGEDNAYAHIKRQIMGREAVVAVTEGRLDFGTADAAFLVTDRGYEMQVVRLGALPDDTQIKEERDGLPQKAQPITPVSSTRNLVRPHLKQDTRPRWQP
jgi:hypothetical protein